MPTKKSTDVDYRFAVTNRCTFFDRKKIQDPTEYSAYRKALDITDLEQNAAALEAFVQRYPSTVVKRDALEHAMLSYQEANDYRKLLTAAEHVLEIDPDNIRALAILVEIGRRSNDDARSIDYAKRGLDALPKWQKPEGMSDTTFKNLHRESEKTFYSAIGFGALTAKDFVTARENYVKSLSLDSNNMMDTYQLGIADLEMKPLDPQGFWYVAKAVSLAKAQGNAGAARAIRIYGTSKYQAYHGGIDGWDEIIARSGYQASPPLDFTVVPASTSK